MLKALELNGFKSFADKTRFEFPPGVTVVVGPNGSGKSNIVDAIKWVLGAQSVKAMRGKEMADVIFNGSGARRPLNSADTTLTFDNSKSLLAVDTKLVHVTRRIYRSGEGEYLINHQPCRLRDIRELFAGTGIATEAYSVIEQGKVDVMLQSSPKDRRLIFEEAAGISRFKAKKLEAIRRLDRVQQNLLRLSDIVDEVESRLRTIRSQAGKAQRYKEYTDRLQELRTQVALADWHSLTTEIDSLETELKTLCENRDNSVARIEAIEAEQLAIDTQLATHDEQIRTAEAESAANRQSIATAEATLEHERSRFQELETEATRHQNQLASMRERTGDLAQQLRETTQSLDEANKRCETARERLAQDEQKLKEYTDRQSELRKSNQENREAHMRLVQTVGRLESQISAITSQHDSAKSTQERCKTQLAELEQRRDEVAEELESSQAEQDELEKRYNQRKQELEATQSTLAKWRRDLRRQQKELSELQGRRTGAAQRKDVLEELERRLEGLSSGVKQVLSQVQETPGDGPYREVRGLVADLLHVSVESAALVEVALGEQAQFMVVESGTPLMDHLSDPNTRLPGRVGFLRLDLSNLDDPNTENATAQIELDGQPGVLGRADRFVETKPEFKRLAERLLGRHWFVETLHHARALADGDGAGLNFVTLAGELLSADGAVTVGPKQSVTGLISRRSELRAIREQLEHLQQKVESGEQQAETLEQQIGEEERSLENRLAEEKNVSEALSARRLQTAAATDRLEQWRHQLETLATEATAATDQIESTSSQLIEATEKLDASQQELAEVLKQVASNTAELEKNDTLRVERQKSTTRMQIELAADEQRLDSLQRAFDQFQRDRQERSQTLEASRRHLDECLERQEQSRRTALSAESQIAELYLEKERLGTVTVEQIDTRETFRNQRTEITSEAQRLRRDLREVERNVHEKELATGQFHLQRDTLIERVADDYNLDIRALATSQATQDASAEELEKREEVESEISELRRKINNIGGVNLEALHELDDLETRYESLSTQFEDLSKAKESLEQIIGRINADSRKMFTATLDTVRGHFQELFRKLFGGGQADIILQEGPNDDVLESGIEIVARPPGKEPRSISLLSGGEKTLTCVALLLSIFRSRPSPFCVLDEVDAALDEANIERFIGVITEFLSSTQFIVVTHSKKTMTAANTLYGVTMQESGISKRVSVRFEDVSEDGHIDEAAVRASLAEEESAKKQQGDDDTQAA